MTDIQWAVLDVNDETVIGIWEDLDSAEVFFLENSADDDNWSIMPALELITVNY